MARHLTIVGTATIASGNSTSGWISPNKVGFAQATDMIIYCPPALTGTVTVEVSLKDSPQAGDDRDLTINGTIMTVAAGTANVLPTSAFRSIRFHSGAAEGADRVFTIMAQVEMQ